MRYPVDGKNHAGAAYSITDLIDVNVNKFLGSYPSAFKVIPRILK